jgi:hypothetical protein
MSCGDTDRLAAYPRAFRSAADRIPSLIVSTYTQSSKPLRQSGAAYPNISAGS